MRLQAVNIVTHHNQLQTIANQAVISVIKLLRISYRRKLLKIPEGKWTQGNLTGFKESVIFSVVYVLFINRFKLLGFNWLIKLPWQLRCPQTEQKLTRSSPPFFLTDSRASETRARVKITPSREKTTRGGEKEKWKIRQTTIMTDSSMTYTPS